MNLDEEKMKNTGQVPWCSRSTRLKSFLGFIGFMLVVIVLYFWYQNSKSKVKLILFLTFILVTVLCSIHYFGQGKVSKLNLLGIISLYILAFVIIVSFSNNNTTFKTNDCIVLPPTSPNATQVFPQSIIIGVRKAGTGALRHYLNLHPNIVIAEQEPNFFSIKYNRGFYWYRTCMPYSIGGQITIEKSSNNFHNAKAAERVFLMNSTIKLILVVREPVERAISDYTQRVVLKKNKTSFWKMFENVKKGFLKKNGTERDFNCIKPSLYYKHMKRWLLFFPLKQIHIVDGDNLMVNPHQEVYKIESFLGLRHEIHKDRFVFNETKGFYCFKNQTMQLECLKESKGRKHVVINDSVITKVRHYLRPLNKRFFNLVHREFDWS